jgi:hypothetical protein
LSSRSRRGLFRRFKAIVVVVGRARRASLGRCRACALSGGGGACGASAGGWGRVAALLSSRDGGRKRKKPEQLFERIHTSSSSGSPISHSVPPSSMSTPFTSTRTIAQSSWQLATLYPVTAVEIDTVWCVLPSRALTASLSVTTLGLVITDVVHVRITVIKRNQELHRGASGLEVVVCDSGWAMAGGAGDSRAGGGGQ